MNYSKEFVPYQVALKLKKLGFDEDCFCGYGKWGLTHPTSGNFYGKVVHQNKHIVKAPLFQQVESWLRDNKGLIITYYKCRATNWLYTLRDGFGTLEETNNIRESFPEAQLAAINQAIKILEHI